MKFFPTLCALFCGAGCALGAPPSLPQLADARLQPLVQQHKVMGMSLGVFINGHTYFRGYGLVAKDREDAPDERTMYEIGSITKVFTALLLAEAAERTKLSLEDEVAAILPPQAALTPNARPIRLRDLAAQISGLPRLPDNMDPASKDPYAQYDAERLYAFLDGFEPPRPPGAQYEYSNLGFALLGHALALKLNAPYEQLVLERICTPLGLNDTVFTLNDDQAARLAPGYAAVSRRGAEPAPSWHFDVFAGAGALRSNVLDLLQFARQNMAPEDSPLDRAMARAQTAEHAITKGMSVGLGWHRFEEPGKPVAWWHNGGTGGYHSILIFSREPQVALVLLANTSVETDAAALKLFWNLHEHREALGQIEKDADPAHAEPAPALTTTN